MARNRGKRSNDQRRLPLAREERLAALAVIDWRETCFSKHQWEQVRQLCMAIELAKDRDDRVRVDVLAAKCRCSKRTLLRTAELGRRAGILGWETIYDQGGRAANRWLVSWDRLSSWAGEWKSGECQTDGTHHKMWGAVSDKKLSLTVTHRPDFLKLNKLTTTLPQGSNPGARGASCGVPDASLAEGWRRVEEILEELRMTMRGRAIAAARGNVPAEHVLALIAHWRASPGAWGVAALCWRIEQARPNLPIADGWPKESEAAAERAAQERKRREAEAYFARQAQARQEREQSAAERAASGPVNLLAELKRLEAERAGSG